MPRCRGLLSGLMGCLTVALVVFVSRQATELNEDAENFPSNAEPQTDLQTISNTQTHRYVTPSLAELGGLCNIPDTNENVLMLTRIPGAGAELLVLMLQRLQGYNAFKHIRLPPEDDGLLSSLQQELLVEEIMTIIRKEAIPLSFDGDLRFLNFSSFARQSPAFVSLVRDPMDPKILERYKKIGTPGLYRGSISYFCGQDPRCIERNNRWALNRAKDNVSRWYRVVGLLDCIDDTLVALQREFPYFFKGAMQMYKKIQVKKKSRPHSALRLKPLARKRLGEIFKDEIEFYQWLKSRLLNGNSDNG